MVEQPHCLIRRTIKMDDRIDEKPRQSMTSSRYELEEQESRKSNKSPETSQGDEEKAIGLVGTDCPATKQGLPRRSGGSQEPRAHSQDGRSLKTTRSHQSRAGGDGYTCFDAEPDNSRPNNSKPGVVTEQPYLVGWDGDADPENPRSMSNLRRWTIVLICSASSLCV
jgi:hypothetical protein